SGARQAGGTADALHRLHRCADPVHVPLPLAAARGRGADGAIRGGGTGRGGRSVDDRRASTRPTLTATVPVLLLPAHPVGRKCPLGNVEAAMTTEAAPLKSARARWLLVATVLGSSMAFLDGTVVNVALPTIGRELGGGLTLQQW